MNLEKLKIYLLSNRIIKPSLVWPDKFPDCWWWTGGKSHGYGRASIKYNRISIHCLAAILWKNYDKNGGLDVLHHCDNTACFNPDHLWFGTQADNNKDCQDKGRTKGNKICGSKHYNSKLNEEQVYEIKSILNRKQMTFKELALKYRVSFGTIQAISNSANWSHVQTNKRG